MNTKNSLLGTSFLVLGLATANAKTAKDMQADRNFLKSMNVKTPGLERVDEQRRKQFWKDALAGARPVTEDMKRKLSKSEKSNNKKIQRKLEEEDEEYDGDDGVEQEYDEEEYDGEDGNQEEGDEEEYDDEDGEEEGEEEDNEEEEDEEDDGVGQVYYGNSYADYYDPNGFTDVSWYNLGFPIQDYSLKYTGCSAVQSWDDQMAEDDADTQFRTNRFAVFRLCPSNKCNSNSHAGCGNNYGEYVLDMEDFLSGVVKFNRQRYWHYCNYCKRCNALESFGAVMSQIEEEKQEYLSEQKEYRKSLQDQQAQYDNAQSQYYQDEVANFDDDGNHRKLSDSNNFNSWYQQNGDNGQSQYGQTGEKNQASYWNAKITNQWQEEWNEDWMNYNWQYLPYCSSSDLETCQNADDMCQDFEDGGYDFDEEENTRFASCTEIDNGYYVAPHCGSDGFTISLGVYSDEYCNEYVKDISIDEVLGYSIEGDFEFFPTSECLSCAESQEDLVFDQFQEEVDNYDDFQSFMEAQFEDYVEYQEEQNNGNSKWRNYQWQSYQNANADANDDQQKGDDMYKYWYEYNRNAYGYGANDAASDYSGKVGTYYNRDKLFNDGSDGKSIGYYTYQNSKYGANGDGDSTYSLYGVSDICGILYEYSAKCNSHLKNLDGQKFINSYMSSQQLQDEQSVCTYIGNLQKNAYNEYGEIVLNGYSTFATLREVDWKDISSVNYARKTINVTPWQTTTIVILILGSVCMLVLIVRIHWEMFKEQIPVTESDGIEEPYEFKREESGIVMGRSESIDGMGEKTTPLL